MPKATPAPTPIPIERPAPNIWTETTAAKKPGIKKRLVTPLESTTPHLFISFFSLQAPIAQRKPLTKPRDIGKGSL